MGAASRWGSWHLRDGQLQQIIGQMIETSGDGQAQGVIQDAAGLAGQALGGLAQDFQPGIGDQGMAATVTGKPKAFFPLSGR